jgi:hypothetical protein
VCIESYAFRLFALPEIERLGSTTITVVPLFSYTELERTAGNLAGRSLHRAYRVNCTDQIRTSRERYADEVRAHDSNAGKSRQRMGRVKKTGVRWRTPHALTASQHVHTIAVASVHPVASSSPQAFEHAAVVAPDALAVAEYDPSGARLAPE